MLSAPHFCSISVQVQISLFLNRVDIGTNVAMAFVPEGLSTLGSTFSYPFPSGWYTLCFPRKLPLLYKNSRDWLKVDCLYPNMSAIMFLFPVLFIYTCLSAFLDHCVNSLATGPPLLSCSSVDLCDAILVTSFPELPTLSCNISWPVQFI